MASVRRQCVLIMVGVLLGPATFLLATPGMAAASAAPGAIDHAQLSAAPGAHAVGRPFVLTATLYFGADASQTMVVHGLNLSLTLEPGLALVQGDSPRLIESYLVPPSPPLYAAVFTWILNATRAGDFRIALAVAAASAGSTNASAPVSVREGPVLGRVTLQPATPRTAAPVSFALPVSSGFDDPNVTLNVTLFVFPAAAWLTPASAINGTLRLANADRSWTFVKGRPIPMLPGGGDTFSCAAAPFDRGALIFWVYAEARLPNGTAIGAATSEPLKIFVEDPGVTAAVFWGAIGSVAAVVAAAFYVMFYDPFDRKPASGALHNSPDRIRAGLLMFVVGACLLGAAVALGAATGFWGWFGFP